VTAPTEIKAQAIAFYALGYSYGNIDEQLRGMFPGADIPRYCTRRTHQPKPHWPLLPRTLSRVPLCVIGDDSCENRFAKGSDMFVPDRHIRP